VNLMPDQALPQLAALAGQLDAIADRLQKVADVARRTRRLTIALAASFILDIALTIIVTFLTLSAIQQGDVIHQSQRAACAVGNEARLQQIQLWGYVIGLSQNRPGQDKQQLKQFQAYIDHTFAPVNCAKLYP
jgi:hypothetical protein